MLSYLDGASQSFVTAMNKIDRRLARASAQVSSGKRVTTISDEPDSVSTLLQVRADMSRNKQIQSNLSRVKGETDGAETAMQSAVKLLERAQVLCTSANTSTATADTRLTTAAEVGSLMEQMVGLANTQIEGRYVFSGNSDQQPAYSIDLSQDPPFSTYAGSAATRLVEHPNGAQFAVSRSAQEIFESSDSSKNVFATLQTLYAKLKSNDSKGIQDVQGAIGDTLKHLNQQLAFYGTVQNKVADATTFSQSLNIQLQTHVASLEDADMTEAITEFSQAQLQQNAALQVRSKTSAKSLFDFLG